MKKIFLFLTVSVLFLTSCKSDDDTMSIPVQDPFVGLWQAHTAFYNDNEIPLDDCRKESTLSVQSNGNYTMTAYAYVDAECHIDDITSGTWVNQGNGVYRLTSEGDTVIQQISFEDDKMYIDETNEGDIFRFVFIRQ